jgi:ribonuclease HI
MTKKIIIFTDGGARGNPGPAASAAVVDGKDFSEFIGEATNNVAEYRGLLLGLKSALKLVGKKNSETELEIKMDSELVVKQLRGEYKIKNQDLKLLAAEVLPLVNKFKKVSFSHVPREENFRADKLVNEVLDKRGTN